MKIIVVEHIEAGMVVAIQNRVIAVDQIDLHPTDGVVAIWDESNIEYTFKNNTKAIVLGNIAS